MTMQDALKGKNQTYKNDIVEFYRGGIESKSNYSFIPFISITRIYLGELSPTTALNPKHLLFGAVAGIVGLLFFITGKWWGILLGIIALLGAIVLVLRAIESKKWYALNIEMSSSAVYSFIADNKAYTDKGYGLLLSVINEREENRQGKTFNFLTGDVTIIDGDGNQTIIGGENHSQTRG